MPPRGRSLNPNAPIPAASRPFNPATQASSQTQGLPQQPNAEAWEGIGNRYMEELAKAYSAAIGADVKKVHVSNPEKFGAIVNAVDMLKGEKVGQGLDPIEAGNAAFQDVFLQMGVSFPEAGIAPGLSMMLADKQKEELRNAPQPSQFQNIKTGLTNPEGNLTPMSVVRGISGAFGSGDMGINAGPLQPTYDQEGIAARAALGNPFTPTIPKSFVDNTGGFNKVARETIRGLSSPASIGTMPVMAGATTAGAAGLRIAAAKAVSASPAKAKALTIAANLIDDGTYATALRMEAQGELGASLLINALEDQGVEMNLAQQIGAGLLGGVSAITVPSLAKKGITSGAGQVTRRLAPGSSIDLGVDDLEVRRQQLDFVANADRKTADRQQIEMLLNAEGRGSTLVPGDALEADDPVMRRGLKGVELNQETGQYEEVPLPTARTPGEAVERAMRPPDNTYSLLGDSRRPFGNSRGLTSGLPGLPGSDAPWAPNSAVVRDFDDLRRGTRAAYPNMSDEFVDGSVEFFRRRAELVAPKRGITPEQWLRTKIAGFNLDGIVYMDGQAASSTREFGLGGMVTGMPTIDPQMAGNTSKFIRGVVQSNQGRAGGVSGGGRGVTSEELISEAEVLWHEFGHVIRKDLWDMDEDALSVLEAWAGIPTGSTKGPADTWGPDAEERWARGFVQWLSEGIEPEGWSAELKQIFLNIAQWLKNVPEATGAGTSGRQSLEDPEVKKAFDQILSDKKLLGEVETRDYLDDVGARSVEDVINDFDEDPNAGRFGNPELEVGKKSLRRQLDDLDDDIDELERIGKDAYGSNYDNVLDDLLSEREGIQDQLDYQKVKIAQEVRNNQEARLDNRIKFENARLEKEYRARQIDSAYLEGEGDYVGDTIADWLKLQDEVKLLREEVLPNGNLKQNSKKIQGLQSQQRRIKEVIDDTSAPLFSENPGRDFADTGSKYDDYIEMPDRSGQDLSRFNNPSNRDRFLRKQKVADEAKVERHNREVDRRRQRAEDLATPGQKISDKIRKPRKAQRAEARQEQRASTSERRAERKAERDASPFSQISGQNSRRVREEELAQAESIAEKDVPPALEGPYESFQQPFEINYGPAAGLDIEPIRPTRKLSEVDQKHSQENHISYVVRDRGRDVALIGFTRHTPNRKLKIGSGEWHMNVASQDSIPLSAAEISGVVDFIKVQHGTSARGRPRIKVVRNLPDTPDTGTQRNFADEGSDLTPEELRFEGRALDPSDPVYGLRDAAKLKAREQAIEADVAALRNKELTDAPDFAGKTNTDDATVLEDPWARYNEEIKVPEDKVAQALHAARLRQSERLGLESGDPVSVEAEKSALAGTAIPFETSDRLVREHITPRMVDIIKRAGRQTDADIEARAATARQAAAASANIYRTSPLTGEALGKQATGPLKAVDEKPLSAYERAPLRGEGADPANALSDADIHLIFESVNRNPRMKPYTKLNTFKAIYKLIDGEHVTKFDIQRLRAVFGKEVTAGMFDSRGLKRKIFDEIMDILGIPRLLLATMDFSAPLRQALLPLGGHPIRWAKTWGPAWKGAISGKYYDQQRAARQAKANHRIFTEPSSPNLPENQRGLGLFETDPEAGLAQSEEAFLSEFLKKLPDRAGNLAAWTTRTPGAKKPVKSILSGIGTVAGYPIRFSERGWSGFLDELRYGLMDDAWESWKRPGSLDSKGKASFNYDKATGDLVPTGQTLKDGRDLARYINISTGRGDLGMLEGAAAPLANIFFSPRLMAARFEAPYELLRYDRSKRVKNHIYRDMGGTMAGGATVLGLAAIAGASVELNPTSSDAGRIQVGNTRVDIWGGFQPLVRTIARVAMRERKSTGTGRITDLDKNGIGLVIQEIINFFRAKLAPVVGFGIDIGAKGDFTGDEIDFGPGNRMELVIARFAPLLAQDLIESYRTDGLTGAALAAPSFFGTSVISYQGVEEVSRRDYKYPEGHPNKDRPGRKGLANLTDSDHSVFQDLPPFLQDNAIAMNKFEGSQQDSEFSAQIAQIDEDYFTTLTGIVDDMDKTDSEKVSAFFAAGNTRADKRSAAFKTQYGDFERPDGEPKDDNARAMRSYYDLVNFSINADKSFNRERFNNDYAEYENIWSEEQIQWVRSNTNSKIIPDKMFDLLPDKQKINFMLSNKAREELTEIWAKDEAEVNAQIESRRPDIEEVRTGIKEGQVVIDSDYNDARIRDGLPPLAEAPSAVGFDEFATKETRAKKKLPPPLAIPTRVPKVFDEFSTADTRATATAAAGR